MRYKYKNIYYIISYVLKLFIISRLNLNFEQHIYFHLILLLNSIFSSLELHEKYKYNKYFQSYICSSKIYINICKWSNFRRGCRGSPSQALHYELSWLYKDIQSPQFSMYLKSIDIYIIHIWNKSNINIYML